ncbi:MAG: hypothetical protein NXI32_14675, partial [bacterium]|nr:hypothetical protein [bacterium]
CPRLKTQDSRLKTQDSRLKTQDSRLKTQDSRLKTQDFRAEALLADPPPDVAQIIHLLPTDCC